jgi:hypothetical protein
LGTGGPQNRDDFLVSHVAPFTIGWNRAQSARKCVTPREIRSEPANIAIP